MQIMFVLTVLFVHLTKIGLSMTVKKQTRQDEKLQQEISRYYHHHL